MIGKLKGVVDEIGEDELILDVGGVGYVVAASARTLRALPAVGEAATLFIETQAREDSLRLYGFLNSAERDWFRLLQSVQGVGAKLALAILGTLSSEALATAIARQDKATMARAPGVGPKLAALALMEVPVAEYAANLIKKTVVGVGHAEKRQVAAMVARLLPASRFSTPDAADALAAAICHAQHRAARARGAARERA